MFSSVVVFVLFDDSVLIMALFSWGVVRFINGIMSPILIFFAKIFWCLWEIWLLFFLLADWFCYWFRFWLPCSFEFVGLLCYVIVVAFMAVYFLTVLADDCTWLAIFEALYVVGACIAIMVSSLLECCFFEGFESTLVILNVFLFGCWDPWVFAFMSCGSFNYVVSCTALGT